MQVKIRGLRVELGEIEAALSKQESVGTATVRVVEHPATKEAALVACLTPAVSIEQEDIDGEPMSLRDALESFDVYAALNASRELLPEAFVPLAAVAMESLPLLPSGKVDQSSIPEPDWQALSGVKDSVAPTTPLETQIHAIWADVLHTPNLSITAVSLRHFASAKTFVCDCVVFILPESLINGDSCGRR